jgi:RNA polymerase sigma-70 factor, ECF subfamily
VELAGRVRTLICMSADSALDDAELWRAAAMGDPEAFAELYGRHVQAVFAFCARRTGDLSLAEDLTSVVFLEAWRRRRSVQLNGRSALPWLLGTAHNVVRNQRRSLRRHRAALLRLSSNGVSPSGEDEVIARLDAQRALTAALEALKRLPEEQQDAVNLVLWSGLSYEEAALALGVPVGTVRSRIARARATLSASLATSTTSKELS